MDDGSLECKVRQLFQNQAEWKEGEHLEFKRADTKIPDSMWETFSAFANTSGGIILLGVEDGGRVCGVTNAEQMYKNLIAALNNPQKINCTYFIQSVRSCILTLGDGLKVIALEVPPAPTMHKPVCIAQNWKRSFYRMGEGDYVCSDASVRQMISDSRNEFPSTALRKGTSMSCVDEESWHDYRQRMAVLYPTHHWVSLNERELMIRLGAWVQTDEGEGLTTAGLLMFGKDESIRRYFPTYQVDYFEYDGSEDVLQGRRWADRITFDGTWCGNLFRFFFRVLPKLLSSLRSPFELKADLVAQGASPAQMALREALVNAVVHADYFGHGGIVIRRYPDRLELSNAGSLLMPREEVFRGGRSVCRNPGLQTMFRFIGMAEKAGSGIDMILKGWESEFLADPELSETLSPPGVTWRMPLVSLISTNVQKGVISKLGEQVYDSLSKDEQKILLIIAQQGQAKHADVRSLLPGQAASLTRLLGGLERKGCLETIGRARGKTYMIHDLVQKTELGEILLQKKEDAASSCGGAAAYPNCVNEVIQQRRVRPDILSKAILELCRDRWRTCSELADILRRERRTIMGPVNALIAVKQLRLQYPDQPKHPRQGYRVV